MNREQLKYIFMEVSKNKQIRNILTLVLKQTIEQSWKPRRKCGNRIPYLRTNKRGGMDRPSRRYATCK